MCVVEEERQTTKTKFGGKKWLLAGIVAVAALGAAAYFSVARPNGSVPGGKTTLDIYYVPGSHNPSQSLDLTIPATALKPAPLIVFIHGGGWLKGTKRPGVAPLVVPHGYACASINYRLTDEAIFPAQIYDCKAAIRFLRAHAGEYNIDPDHIGVWGISAGGHLAALLGTTNGDKALEGDEGNLATSSDVQAVADWCGPTDLVSAVKQAKPDNLAKLSSPDGVLARLLGGLPDQHPDLAKQASPVDHVSKKMAGGPPFFILHGDADNVVPFEQSEELYEKLRGVGAPVEMQAVNDAGHDLSSKEGFELTRTFFDQHLKASAGSS